MSGTPRGKPGDSESDLNLPRLCGTAIDKLTFASFACASDHVLLIAKQAIRHVQPDPVVHAARRGVPDRSSTDHREVGCFHGNHCTSRNWPFSFNQEADFAPIYRTGFDAALARLPFFPTKMQQAVERKAFMQSTRGRIIGIAGPACATL